MLHPIFQHVPLGGKQVRGRGRDGVGEWGSGGEVGEVGEGGEGGEGGEVARGTRRREESVKRATG